MCRQLCQGTIPLYLVGLERLDYKPTPQDYVKIAERRRKIRKARRNGEPDPCDLMPLPPPLYTSSGRAPFIKPPHHQKSLNTDVRSGPILEKHNSFLRIQPAINPNLIVGTPPHLKRFLFLNLLNKAFLCSICLLFLGHFWLLRF